MKTYWIYSITFLLLGISAFVYLDCINLSIAFDDAYTMRMTQLSYIDILHITSQDVHPPLYYWLLKTYSSVFGYTMHAQRIFSVIGLFASMLLALFPIRKHLGERTSLLFLILLIIFPATQFLGLEIRMYSWAMFFSLGTGAFAYAAYTEGKKMSYFIMICFALCAAYTHYYALITVGWIFILLFFFLWKQKKSKHIWVISVIIFTILYLPWASQLLFQIRQVSNHYWIEPISKKDIYYHLYFLYSIKKDWLPFSRTINGIFMLGTAIVMLSQIIMLSYSLVVYIKNKNRQDLLVIISVLLFILPILSGLLFSLFIRPVLVPRYMLCSFGFLLLGLSIAYNKYFNQRHLNFLIFASLIILSISSVIRYWGTIRHLKTEQNEAVQMKSFIKRNCTTTNVFLGEHYGASALSRLSVLYPDKAYYILTFRESKETFEPFDLKKVYHNEPFANEFIFVQKSENEGGLVARNFKHALMQNYYISDSIKVLNMELYKMQLHKLSYSKDKQ